jgi:isoquinoline 1-oxidoreductase beta subunit
MTVLKPRSAQRIVGTPRGRIDALDAIPGRKAFAMDLVVPDALPTMLCRPPTLARASARRLSERRSAPVGAA